jgi:hypothetical protein
MYGKSPYFVGVIHLPPIFLGIDHASLFYYIEYRDDGVERSRSIVCAGCYEYLLCKRFRRNPMLREGNTLAEDENGTEEQEKMTMNQRIKAFYQQSGGPSSPEINKILEEHLRNGKDHGVKGRKETINDAFIDVFLGDHSTQGIAIGFMKLGNMMKNQWDAFLNSRSIDAGEMVRALKAYEEERSAGNQLRKGS